mmetsp:Transcript_18043/g.17365  ORF Transcript_18043/g.17365 Transcript_18043/m.17365 type:complete len:269 (-) Transcript_18043:678-1484(-)
MAFFVFPLFDEMAFSEEVSPFLMFDYGAPKKFDATTKRRGVGSHPHRGMETVTIALQGEVEHGDSIGNSGVIGPGEVQWMTAGRGIIHNEYHSTEFAKSGGTMEMMQLWVNLPAAHKLSPPKYQSILKDEIPTVQLDGNAGTVRVIAGDFHGTKGRASTFTPVNLWDINLTPNQIVNLSTVEGHTTIIFCRTGSVKAGTSTTAITSAQIALLTREGNGIRLESGEKGVNLMVLDGQPIKEPIAARGPFVMNTDTELRQAMQDYQNGRF